MIELDPGDERRALRSHATALVERTLPLSSVRELAEDGAPPATGLDRVMGDAGWFSLLGGDGADPGGVEGIGDAAAVAEVRGAMLQPGPFVAMNLATMILGRSGHADHRALGDEISAGTARAAWACTDRSGQWGSGAILDGTGSGPARLRGCCDAVPDADGCAMLLVRARTVDQVVTVVVRSDAPGLSVERLDGFDLTRNWSRVRFDDVAVPPADVVATGGSDSITDPHLQIAATLQIAESVGALERLFARTVRYAEQRQAFGRPIGSFQALKHLLADASVAVETSAAVAAAAIDVVATGHPDAAEVVAMAKAWVGDASLDAAHVCWQVHGGVAYTWNHDFHLYLRRLTADAASYGDPTWLREQICRLHDLTGQAAS